MNYQWLSSLLKTLQLFSTKKPSWSPFVSWTFSFPLRLPTETLLLFMLYGKHPEYSLNYRNYKSCSWVSHLWRRDGIDHSNNVRCYLWSDAVGNFDFDRFCPSVITAATVCTSFVVGTLFSTITAIAMDRYLALFLHLRYQERVTVNIALVISWVLKQRSKNDIVSMVLVPIGRLVQTVVYFRIY